MSEVAVSRAKALVLVVDDDADSQFIFPAALEHAGFAVHLAVNGVEALQAIAAQTPDVVVLDFAMPRLSGPELFARLRADDTTRAIPVIACTAMPVAADVPRLRGDGYADVLIKPVDPALLVAAVQRACDRTTGHP
ncbi:MAG TPA: response regulator, partial [Gemmatimonadaceae bacterium]|nr:response regulator [Gemmatimonadaceae bacterium]